MAQTRMVALLRGINVGGHRKVPMAELRALAQQAGLGDVETYIQSGNVVFTSAKAPEAVATTLEAAIEKKFGFFVDVVVRTQAQWAKYAAGSPYPQAAAERPNLLHLALSRKPPVKGAAEALQARCTGGETLTLVGDALWVDFAGGVARSKLTPAALDKALGSTVTARNWKTVQQLAVLLAGAPD